MSARPEAISRELAKVGFFWLSAAETARHALSSTGDHGRKAPHTMTLEPLIQMPTAWTGIADRFGVHLFQGKVTVSDMDRLEASGSRWYRNNPGQTAELVVIYSSAAHMTGEERERMAKIIKRWEGNRVASATTILAEGLRGALHRSVLTGLLFLAPPPHPAKVFGKVADAVDWLAPHVRSVCGPDATRAALSGAVDAFCQEFEARRER
jgi:hypothetical protein